MQDILLLLILSLAFPFVLLNFLKIMFSMTFLAWILKSLIGPIEFILLSCKLCLRDDTQPGQALVSIFPSGNLPTFNLCLNRVAALSQHTTVLQFYFLVILTPLKQSSKGNFLSIYHVKPSLITSMDFVDCVLIDRAFKMASSNDFLAFSVKHFLMP